MIAPLRYVLALIATVSLIASSQAQVINYFWNGGAVTNTSSWGTNLNGTGTPPPDFITANQLFNIQNGQSASTASIWTISGTGSGLTVQTGGVFTSTVNNSLKLSMQNGASYIQSNSYAGTSSGTLDPGSTFFLSTPNFNTTLTYGGFTNIAAVTQNLGGGTATINGNLQQSGSGELQFTATTAGTLNIGRDLLVDSTRTLNMVSTSGTETINLSGNYVNSGTVKSGGGIANFKFVGLSSSNVTFGAISGPTGTINYSVVSGKTVVFQDTLNTAARVTLTNAGTIQLGTGGTTGGLLGNFFTNNGLLIINHSDNLTLSGNMSGTGSVQQSGAGITTLSGTNTYSGITTVNNGFIAINDEARLGKAPTLFTANQVTLDGGGIQAVNSSVDFLSSNNRGFTLGSSGGTFDTNAQGFSIGTAITGPGSLTKIGASNLTLTAASNYLGNTGVQTGSLSLYSMNGSSDNRLPASTVLTLGSGANSAVLMLGNETVNPSNPANQSLAGLTTSGTGATNAVIGNTAASATLTITNSVANTFNGTIGGAGLNNNNLNVVKSNSGTLTLNGNDTYIGTTTINGGTLLVNGTHSSSGIYTVNSGVLGGTGTINADVNLVAGALSPGNSPGRLTVNGNVTFSSTSSFNIEINGGATAGVDYDQLRVGAGKSLTLNGATLNITLGFMPNSSEKIFLTDDLFSGRINGTFAGLSEGSLITIGDYTANISYLGDFPSLSTFGGNDFVLYNFITTAVPEPGTYALLLLTGFFALQWYLRLKTTEDKKFEEKTEGVPTESVPMEVAFAECEC